MQQLSNQICFKLDLIDLKAKLFNLNTTSNVNNPKQKSLTC